MWAVSRELGRGAFTRLGVEVVRVLYEGLWIAGGVCCSTQEYHFIFRLSPRYAAHVLLFLCSAWRNCSLAKFSFTVS